jgi:hypothetical protein
MMVMDHLARNVLSSLQAIAVAKTYALLILAGVITPRGQQKMLDMSSLPLHWIVPKALN